MSKSAVVVSVLALGLSGYTAWATGVFCGSCLCSGARPGAAAEPDDVAALSARIRTLEERLAGVRAPAALPIPHDTPSADVRATRSASGTGSWTESRSRTARTGPGK